MHKLRLFLTLLDLASIIFSIKALDIPIALIGLTDLSVLKKTIFLTLESFAASIIFSVPKILVFTASWGKNSHDGTCFKAAA